MVGGTSEIGYDRFMAWSERIGIISLVGSVIVLGLISTSLN